MLEGGPDCFLSDKPRTLQLLNELGLAGEIVETRQEHRRSFIVREGQLHAVPAGFYLLAPSRLRPFLASPLISWRGKWRVLLEALIPARRHTPHPGPSPLGRGDGEGYDESLASFVRRRLGKEALEWLAQPLLAGIYAADPETLSLQATFPQFLEMEENPAACSPLWRDAIERRGRPAAHATACLSV